MRVKKHQAKATSIWSIHAYVSKFVGKICLEEVDQVEFFQVGELVTEHLPMMFELEVVSSK